MNRIDRLFAILTLLQSRKFVSAEKIADTFHISVRTVYRDIKALSESGIPVGFEAAKGYFIVQGYFLSPVAFTSEEANALLLMESMVAGFTDKSISQKYSSALTKVKAVLRNYEKEKLDALGHKIKFQFPERLKNDKEYLSELQNAISSKLIIEIEYQNHQEEKTKRKIECIGLIFYAFNWHVIAWCHLRNDYRDFKVSRISALRILNIQFSKSEHISLNEYMKQLPVSY